MVLVYVRLRIQERDRVNQRTITTFSYINGFTIGNRSRSQYPVSHCSGCEVLNGWPFGIKNRTQDLVAESLSDYLLTLTSQMQKRSDSVVSSLKSGVKLWIHLSIGLVYTMAFKTVWTFESSCKLMNRQRKEQGHKILESLNRSRLF